MATYSWLGTTSTWSTATNWRTGGGAAGSAPGVGDDCVFDGSDGGSSSADCTLTGSTGVKSINFTGYTGTFTINASVTLTIGSAGQTGGVATFVSGQVQPVYGSTTTSILAFDADGGTNTLTPGGKTMPCITIGASNAGSTVSLGGALAMTSAASTLLLTRGTFNANNQNVSVGLFSSNNSNTRVITMGSGTWTIAGTSGVPWNISATTTSGLTFNKDTANIVISGNSGSTNITFAGAGLTYNTVSVTGGSGAGSVLFQGTGNTYTDFALTAPATIIFNSSQTHSITNAFAWTGTASNPFLIKSSTEGTNATIAQSGTTSTISYGAIKNITFSQAAGATLTASNSLNIGGNSGTGFTITGPSGGGGARVIGG